MNIKGILFDFDGTLFDSMSIWETAAEKYFSSVGYKAEQALCKQLHNMCPLEFAQYTKAHYDVPMTEQEIIDGINKTVEDFYFYHAMPKENVKQLLSELHSRGIKMCIATASDRYQVEAALVRCGMMSFFDEIFICSELGHGKNEPYVFAYAREHMGLEKSEMVIFEDAHYAAKTAKESGFYVVGIYDEYEKKTDELKTLADMYIESFPPCAKILDEILKNAKKTLDKQLYK